MVIVMQEGATEAQIQHVIDRLVASGFNVHRSTGESHTVLGGLADAAVIGSALVSEIEKATVPNPTPAAIDAAASALTNRLRLLKEAARHGLSRREAPMHRGKVAP